MKKPILPIVLAVMAAAFVPALRAADANKESCASIGATVKDEVTAKPDQVLVIVSEKIGTNPTCACEIVHAAIKASKADKDLVGEIVFTAVSAAPKESTTIAECAVAAAPEASENVKAALRRAMSDKNPVGKSVDKGVVETQQTDLGDFGLSLSGRWCDRNPSRTHQWKTGSHRSRRREILPRRGVRHWRQAAKEATAAHHRCEPHTDRRSLVVARAVNLGEASSCAGKLLRFTGTDAAC
jgi:hypothetical protein